jgi:hypothetical protein
MIPRIPTDPARRARRKADLLLASAVMRGELMLDVQDVGGRADVWGRRWQWLKGWMSDPLVLAVAGGGAAFMAASGRRRRGQLWRAGRWVWMAWRIWRRR